ncbi:MAG: DNA starvation/stationary phase protection protein [Alphaproteobacteria bacterium]|nr:DNA starvation/stationary phase protection protein [Alphaproteobacteria bacterium]
MTDHLSAEGRKEITMALTEYFADTTVVYFKTHGFHWNVEGTNFYPLHLMFEKFYQELWESMDEVAERIRTFGEHAPSGFSELLNRASIQESVGVPASHIMIATLRADYLVLAAKAYEVGSIANGYGDVVTTDMMTEKATFLEKAAWMLQSSMQ